MTDHTRIEWTDATWNPVTGCANSISREVVFTDYECDDKVRMEVRLNSANGALFAAAVMPGADGTDKYIVFDDVSEPNVLRSYAHCLLAAAEEMEKVK